ncbi:hypothetical protein HD554DRAFT_500290 [Boletus coccyginus]|nr:hypothetical protein HD554DRAFT_500290 [Boletus coccyginus]
MIFQSQSLVLLPVLVTFLGVLEVHGYIPARASNVTVQGSGEVNKYGLHLQWYTNGSDWVYVTQQPVGPAASNDHVQGILVHFTEDNAGNETTTTPWIAFVSCDSNSTNPPHETDIFTMAKDRGANSAILYSLYSETCVINPGYRDSALDVFAIQTLNASRHIEYEFGQFGPSSETYYGYFNAAMLNDVAGVINNTIAFNYPTAPGFLFATLPAHNDSGVGMSNSGLQADVNGTGTSTNTSGGNSADSSIAMIILYAITGCVSAFFCGVIISGAIRAIRHPERYGPRPADPTLGGGQSRAGGIGRAILDTFPVVKFGSSSGNDSRPKDIESAPMATGSSIPVPPSDSVQLAQLSYAAEHSQRHDLLEVPITPTTDQGAREDNQASEGTDQVDPLPRINTADSASPRKIVPECIGRETCPICIVDFEEGDDLRVLPCEGKHRFHQSCVDPWLLELSGSCPLCRQDFHALETIISGGPENEASPVNRHSTSSASIQHNRRFSRYLRFALGRQQTVGGGEQGSPPPPES